MNERKEISKEETVTIQRKEPSREGITRVAYGLYLQRSCEPGKDVEDWLRAEKELSCVGAAAPVKTKVLVGHA